mgnify:CR=1 FL=1
MKMENPMSDNFENDYTEDEEESFAELFESFEGDTSEDLQVGDRVKGEIIAIGMDTVFVNTGAKIDGAVSKVELLDDNGEFSYGIGDVLELYVVAFDENEMRLSSAFTGVGGLNLLHGGHPCRENHGASGRLDRPQEVMVGQQS